MVKLTPQQRLFLIDLVEGGPFRGWPAHGNSCRMFQRCVDRGLVAYTPPTAKGVAVFTITEAGREALQSKEGEG